MIKLLREVDFRQTKANARNVLKNFRRLERIAGRSLIDLKSPIITDMPKSQSHGNKADALVQLADAEAERDAILSALMALSLTSRQILHYSFCVQDHYSNYKIAREVGYSERSIQRMKSEALIEFAEAYRNGKIIAYK
ncbi:ArpU family phage packaging/lysis transcriptional regulator [Enterococcus faecalis]|uniref:ArpU family phage packaging/lysis transcriptional regulator n=1 Tax=Enterococcus faecalis TaxID=1351 RepID=UPI001F5B5E79|nr:ArpU family phage packaging/lysis transcriptional regulator [Enterococcus faecalis]UNQ09191.1 autolysin [Enterococcus faecalis]